SIVSVKAKRALIGRSWLSCRRLVNPAMQRNPNFPTHSDDQTKKLRELLPKRMTRQWMNITTKSAPTGWLTTRRNTPTKRSATAGRLKRAHPVHLMPRVLVVKILIGLQPVV